MSLVRSVARLELLDSSCDEAVLTIVFRRAAAFGDREPQRARRPSVVGYVPPVAETKAQTSMHVAGIRVGVHLRPIQETEITSELEAVVIHTDADCAAAAGRAQAAGIPIINSWYLQGQIDKRQRGGFETNPDHVWRVLFEVVLNIDPRSNS